MVFNPEIVTVRTWVSEQYVRNYMSKQMHYVRNYTSEHMQYVRTWKSEHIGNLQLVPGEKKLTKETKIKKNNKEMEIFIAALIKGTIWLLFSSFIALESRGMWVKMSRQVDGGSEEWEVESEMSWL